MAIFLRIAFEGGAGRFEVAVEHVSLRPCPKETCGIY